MTDLFLLSRVQMRRIERYFPLSHGVARVDDRRIVSAIVFVIKNGLRWRDAPPVTLLIIFFLLFLNFGRLTETLIVMLSLPFALVGGLWLMWWLGFNMSVAVVVGFIIYGVKVSALRVPGEKATDIGVVLYAVPGALIGIALIYFEGMRRERAAAEIAPQ